MSLIDFKIVKNNLIEFADLSIEMADKIMRSSMSVGANIIGKQARANLMTKVQGAMGQLPEGGSLYQGIRVFTWRQAPAATVHIYGTTNGNTGDWRLRFFEAGTKPRYQKTKQTMPNGKQKKVNTKYLGQLKPTWFFRDAVLQTEAQVAEAVKGVAENKIKEIEEKV